MKLPLGLIRASLAVLRARLAGQAKHVADVDLIDEVLGLLSIEPSKGAERTRRWREKTEEASQVTSRDGPGDDHGDVTRGGCDVTGDGVVTVPVTLDTAPQPSSLLLSSPDDQQQADEKPRLLSSPASSELLPDKPSRHRSAGARGAEAATTPTWEAYAVEYQERYKAKPLRNAKANALLVQFLKLVPGGEAPAIAAYYVQSPNAYYVRRGHPLDCLVSDAQKLRTEAITGRRITSSAAYRVDKTADRGDQYGEMLGRLAAKDAAESGKVGDGKA